MTIHKRESARESGKQREPGSLKHRKEGEEKSVNDGLPQNKKKLGKRESKKRKSWVGKNSGGPVREKRYVIFALKAGRTMGGQGKKVGGGKNR